MNYYLYLWRPNSAPQCTARELSGALQGNVAIPELEEVDFGFVIDAFQRFELNPAPFKPSSYSGFAPGGPITIQLEPTLCGWCSHYARPEVINEFIALGQAHDCFVCDRQISEMIPDDGIYRAKPLVDYTTPQEMTKHLKSSLIPHLRGLGFKGAYPWLYRTTTETLVLNFQGCSGGGAIRINYGTTLVPDDADAKARKKHIQNHGVVRGVLGRDTPGDFWYRYQYEAPGNIAARMRRDIEGAVE